MTSGLMVSTFETSTSGAIGVKSLVDVERQVLVERRVDAVRGRRAEQDRIAVGARFGHDLGRDIAAGARPVIGDDFRVERFFQRVLQRARDDVDAGPGREIP